MLYYVAENDPSCRDVIESLVMEKMKSVFSTEDGTDDGIVRCGVPSAAWNDNGIELFAYVTTRDEQGDIKWEVDAAIDSDGVVNVIELTAIL